MAFSNLTAIDLIPEQSLATPGLFNHIFSQISDNVGTINQGGVPFNVASGSTWASIGLFANSSNSDYIRFKDSSNQRSTYRLGSAAGGTADGLNIFDESGNTMIVSFSKQSVRFFQQVVGPVFNTAADYVDVATIGTGADSKESRIQAAIDAAALSAISFVFLPRSFLPYSAGSISFNSRIQMVREGGEWSTYDLKAYGAAGNDSQDDRIALHQLANTGIPPQGGEIYVPGPSIYKFGSTVTVPQTVALHVGQAAYLKPSSGFTLAIQGPIIAHEMQSIFSGAGTIYLTAIGANPVSVRWFGAVGDATTDDTPAIRAGVNTMQPGTALYFPPVPFGSYYKITSTVTFPALNGLVFKGAGKRSSQIRQATAGQYCLASASTWGTATNGFTMVDMNLNSGKYCLYMNGTNRFTIVNSRLESATSAGLYLTDCLSGLIEANEFDANWDGIHAVNGGNTGLNGVGITNNNFANQTHFGIHCVDGGSGFVLTGNIIESNARGGVRFGQEVSGVEVEGNYFEQNTDSTNSSFDLDIGTSSYVQGLSVRNNYFNGRVTGTTHDYYPIRLGFVRGLDIMHNFVARGNRFVSFEAGGTLVGCRFGPNAYNLSTDPFDTANLGNAYAGAVQATLTANNVVIAEPIITGQGYGEALFPYVRSKVSGAGGRYTLDRSATNFDSSYRLATAGTDTWAWGNGINFSSGETFEFYNIATGVLTFSLDAARDALVTKASAAAGAGLRLPHGAAPTTPVNGDTWTTTTDYIARLNGTTQSLFDHPSHTSLAVSDASNEGPSIRFSSEASLGLFRAGAGTMALSSGRSFNFNQSRVLSMRTLAASSLTPSAGNTNLRADEIVFTIGGASGASLCIHSGGTVYFFSSDVASTSKGSAKAT